MAVHSSDPAALHALVVVASRVNARVVLLPDVNVAERAALAQQVGAGRVVSYGAGGWHIEVERDPDATAVPPASQLGFFTSGTTGPPKLVWHRWASVSARTGTSARSEVGARWLMTYAPRSFAAIQVLFAALHHDASVWYAPPEPSDVVALLRTAAITVASATPSWWRRLLLNWPRGEPKPMVRQITMGGEPVTQDVLDAVRTAFRPERLTHIYASTEAGSVFSVSDGRAGFPVAWLRSERGQRIRVRDGQLEVFIGEGAGRGPSTESGRTEDGWYRTPDIADVVEDRVVLVGRVDCVINVGGRKLTPEQIELVVRREPGVADCRAFAKRSPITGAVVALEVVPAPGVALDTRALRSRLAQSLPRELVPRLISLVPAITITSAGKRSRVDR
ncbi:MAG: fatty acid--CoA ligase family protein [Gemmatimonadaceae bacterium]|nr:fatty acid--CoA ligase family protein [Gemmatimonadaceae bacterium]